MTNLDEIIFINIDIIQQLVILLSIVMYKQDIQFFNLIKIQVLFLQLTNALTDGEVVEILTNDATLTVLEEIGYRGIPHKESVSTVAPIVQYVHLSFTLMMVN